MTVKQKIPHTPFIGDYCRTCINKQPRCMYKPGSDWDEDLIDIMQTDSPTKKETYMSDWRDQENFWNGKEYEKTRSHKT